MPDYSLADIAAATGNGGGNGNNGGFGNDSSAWWLLVLFALLGGFGNNNGRNGGGGGQGGGMGGYGYVGGDALYPWLNQADQISDGFRDQMMQTTMQGIQQQTQNLATQLCNCCGDIQMALCNGFGSVNMALAQGFAGVEQGANARQMANMQTMFQQQLATQQGFNGIQGQLAAQTATILAENCADRAALSDGVRDIITAQGAGTQRILDKLCDLELASSQRELAAERRENDQLRQQLANASLAASQIAQTGQIVDGIYNRLATCPVGTQPVYGNQPIFTCPTQYQGCGCGCN